jgi:small redox-active disulfide protein 2
VPPLSQAGGHTINEQEREVMKIEILGTGCAKCKNLYENTRKAVEESGKEAEIVKIEDIPSIMKYGVMSTPALVIDGQVKFSGKLASVAEIIGML